MNTDFGAKVVSGVRAECLAGLLQQTGLGIKIDAGFEVSC